MVDFSIVGIIQTVDKQLYCYDTTYKTYKEALVHDTTEFNFIVVIQGTLESGTVTTKFVDMQKLLSTYLVKPAYIPYRVLVWGDLELFLSQLYDLDTEYFVNFLTYTAVPRVQYYKKDGVVYSRATPFKSNFEGGISTLSLGYTSDIIGSYVNKNAPKLRNISSRRISMPDLVFSKRIDTVNYDFSNVIPSVDGVICYPIYSTETDELYACNGARFLKNTTDSNSLNILLLNFANLGTLHHYKLSDCKQELIVKNGDKVWVYDDSVFVNTTTFASEVEFNSASVYHMKFTLPVGAPSGYPFLSLAGRLFIPGLDDIITYTEGGNQVVEFHIATQVLENIVASNLQHQNLFYNKSTLFKVILSYVFCNIFVDQGYEYDQGTQEWKAIQFYMDQIIPFVTIVETDNLYTVEKIDPMSSFEFGKLIFPGDSRGILVNTKTREFIDYVKVEYENQTHAIFTPQHALFIQKKEGANKISDPYYGGTYEYSYISQFIPGNTDLVYVYNEHRYKYITYAVVNQDRKIASSIFAESNEYPFETVDSAGNFKTYSWDDSFGTPVFHNDSLSWTTEDDTGLTIYESAKDENHTATSYQTISWYKLLPKENSKVYWYLFIEGSNVITDGVKFDRMAWQDDPCVFIDPYNQYKLGEFVKNPGDYALLDICVGGLDGDIDLLETEENPSLLPDIKPTTPQLATVYTAEYQRVKDNIVVKTGAPAKITSIKVSPTIVEEVVSTTKLQVRNACNIDEDSTYERFDGTYLQTVEGEVGTARIWKNKDYPSIIIRYNTDQYWEFVEDSTTVFVSDAAYAGSAPYNASLSWRLKNA